MVSLAPGLQALRPSPGPAHLAVLDETSKVFKAIVAEEGGLQHWPVLACQHHGDGICGRVKGQPCLIPFQQHLQSALNLLPHTAQSSLSIITWAFVSWDNFPKSLGAHTHRAC